MYTAPILIGFTNWGKQSQKKKTVEFSEYSTIVNNIDELGFVY